MLYRSKPEHYVTYHEKFFNVIEDHIVGEFLKISAAVAVVVYGECPQPIVNYKDSHLGDKKSISLTCYSIGDALHTHIVKDHIANERFSHLWLLLSETDTKTFLSLLRGLEFSDTHIITTLLSSLEHEHLSESNPLLTISNIQNQEIGQLYYTTSLNITTRINNELQKITSDVNSFE